MIRCFGAAASRLAFVGAAASAGAAQTHVVIVGGLGGEPAYEERFAAQARDVAESARGVTGDSQRVHALSGKDATREALVRTFASVAGQAAADDVLIVAMIGHGNVDGGNYKFNVPGSDPTCDDLRGWLDAVPARRQLVILATSAGGACVAPLARDERVVLSATRSGTERNAPVFARYFTQALRDPAADRDRDENVTALEVFRYTEQKVQRFYADEKRLATEHPVMSSEGARHFVLARRGQAARPLAAGSAAAGLAGRKGALEEDIRGLRSRKAGLPKDEYWVELERVLLELARVQEALDTETGTAR